MFKNRAGWLALSVLAIATILMVFFVMPRIAPDSRPANEAANTAGRDVKATGTQPTDTQATGTQGADAGTIPAHPPQDKAAGTQSKTDLPAVPPPAPVQAAAPSAAPRNLVVPTFDVLRVEPDGSAVIAGRAEPTAKLEVADQVQTVAMTNVDKAGEFVAILDNPLPPGDHQLVLKATAEDGRTVISEEIATVSVPHSKQGELLAMVTKPGAASRIIAMPKTNEAAKTERVAVSPADVVPSSDQAKASQATAPVAAAPKPDAPKAPVAPAPAQQPSETASASPATPSAPAPAADGQEKPGLQVTAVEIEGDRLFIAGLSKPGARVKGYADGTAIGEARAGNDGHFVIDGNRPLTVGEHRIAVDQIDAGGQVALRVEVPFNRPAGEQVAAVAAPNGDATALGAIDQGALDKLRNEVSRAFQLLQTLYANNGNPTDEQVAAARSATAIALRSLTEYRLPAQANANALAIAGKVIADAQAALKALDDLPRDVAGLGAGLPALADMIARVTGPVIPTVPASPVAPPVADAQPSAQSETIAQAPLTQSEAASVIIRRGDTLWQISRRIYGQGVRYTTIYVANQEQIANPNMIEPGQIFGVPNTSLPDDEAEKIHRRFTRG